jgi:tetratricopeptide (TPR) repeat protein
MNRERIDDALAIFKFNLELYPHVANCYDSLAECFMNRNENEEAIKYYKLAYEKNPSDSTTTEDYKEFLKTNIEERLEELGTSINS